MPLRGMPSLFDKNMTSKKLQTFSKPFLLLYVFLSSLLDPYVKIKANTSRKERHKWYLHFYFLWERENLCHHQVHNFDHWWRLLGPFRLLLRRKVESAQIPYDPSNEIYILCGRWFGSCGGQSCWYANDYHTTKALGNVVCLGSFCFQSTEIISHHWLRKKE